MLINGKILLCCSFGFSSLISVFELEDDDESASLFKAHVVVSCSKKHSLGMLGTSLFSIKTTRSSKCALRGPLRLFMILSTMLVWTIFLGAFSSGESSLMTFSLLC